MPIILSQRVIEEASSVADQLNEAFSYVLALPQLKGRRASILTTELGVGRMTCQRLVKLYKHHSNTSTSSNSGARVLIDLPGVTGLKQFLDAVELAGTPRHLLEKAFIAVERYDAFLQDIDMSQSKLASALLLLDQTNDPIQLRSTRNHFYDSAAAVTGQSTDATISIMAIRPSTRNNLIQEQIATHGYAQMRTIGPAMPIRLPIDMAYSDYKSVFDQNISNQKPQLVEHFCTQPLPLIESKEIKSNNLPNLIYPENVPSGEPFDCFVTQDSIWTSKDNEYKNTAIWLYIDYPTRHCVLDLYLHKSLMTHYKLTGNSHMCGTPLSPTPEGLWMKQFSDQIKFLQLGPGTANAESKAYSRHKHLTENMFENHEWNAEDFVGYRCEMELPIWRSGICIMMDVIDI